MIGGGEIFIKKRKIEFDFRNFSTHKTRPSTFDESTMMNKFKAVLDDKFKDRFISGTGNVLNHRVRATY